jgi:hypothetical protein
MLLSAMIDDGLSSIDWDLFSLTAVAFVLAGWLWGSFCTTVLLEQAETSGRVEMRQQESFVELRMTTCRIHYDPCSSE